MVIKQVLKRSNDHALLLTNNRLHTVAAMVEIILGVLGTKSTSTSRSMTKGSWLRIAIGRIGWGLLVNW